MIISVWLSRANMVLTGARHAGLAWIGALLVALCICIGPAAAMARPVLEGGALRSSEYGSPLVQRQVPDSIAALEAKTSALAAQLRCPVCQGLSIEDSPTELALEMRAVIRDQLAAGSTAAEVEEYFVSKYGEWILLQPKPEGFNLAVYALPILALLLGGGVVVMAVRRWTRQGTARYKEVGP